MAKKKPANKLGFSEGISAEAKARVLKSRVEASGKPSRAKGHLSASTRRSQAKRDSKG